MRGSDSVVRQASLLGVVIAAGAAVVFLIAAVAVGGYAPVARYGGIVWVFLLAWIITMPVLAPRLKRRETN